MHKGVALVVLLVACAAPRTAAAPAVPVSPVQYAIDHTVFLAKSGCTGVLMGADRLVTAKHCLPDGAKTGDSYEGGELLYVSPAYDFVVVKFPDARSAVRLHSATIGEHIYVVGYPVQLGSGAQVLTVTDGLVAGPVDAEGQARITAPVYFGNSGGGVWSESGELVGIAVSIYAARIDGYQYPLPYLAQSFMVPVSLIEGHL